MRDAGLQGGDPALRGFRGLRGGLRHFKVIEDGQQFLNQRGGGGLGGFDALAGGAFFEIFKIGGGAQQAVPMFVGLGGARLEFFQLFRREFRGGRDGSFGRGAGGAASAVSVFGVGNAVFFMRSFQAKIISSRQDRRLFGNQQLG